jgi:hypothetical protein
MAITGRGQKTAFLRDLFRSNPKVKYKAANEAWKAAGNEGDLSSNTFYNTMTALKKEAGNGTANDAKPAPSPKPKAQPAGSTRAKTTPAKTSHPENGRAAAPEPPVGRESAGTGDRDRVFDEVEAGIDDLIFRLKVAGGATAIEAKLREVRRLLHPSQR